MKKFKWFILCIFFIILAVITVNHIFLYNPISFKKVIGENTSWYDYRKPLRIEYEYWNTPKPKNIWSYDEQEMKFIYRELSKSEEVNLEEYWGSERFVWFIFRRLSDSNNILHVDLANNKIAKIGDDRYVRITDELWSYLSQVQQREENTSDMK